MALARSPPPAMSLPEQRGLRSYFDLGSCTTQPNQLSPPVEGHSASDHVGDFQDQNGLQATYRNEPVLNSTNRQSTSRLEESIGESEQDHASRKRRKITPSGENAGSLWFDQLRVAAGPQENATEQSTTQPEHSPETIPSMEQVKISNTDIHDNARQEDGSGDENQDPQQPPQKVLRLNGEGGFGSPRKKKQIVQSKTDGSGKASKSRRKNMKSLIVTLTYATTEQEKPNAMGVKIEEIMKGEERVAPSTTEHLPESTAQVTQMPMLAKGSNPSKQTHPFFLGIVNPKPEVVTTAAESTVRQEEKLSDNLKTFSTPGKLRQQRALMAGTGYESSSTRSDPPIFRSSTGPRILGTYEPLWPPKGLVRINHESSREPFALLQSQTSFGSKDFRLRKHKAREINIPAQEDIIYRLSQEVKLLSTHEQASIHCPKREVSSGVQIQRMIRNNIKSPLSAPNVKPQGEKMLPFQQSSIAHPAVQKIFSSLSDCLSAFDKGEYESAEWTHKYGPKSAEHVLHMGKEATALKSWLRSLTVDSVAGTHGDQTVGKHQSAKLARAKKKKRKRRKIDELDDFIVGSDDDDSDMHEMSDDAGELPSDVNNARSVIRPVDHTNNSSGNPSHKANMVLLSGRPGCGKTASVYAVAKELGFEVFEINASSRRSGKDILDRVGDLLLNHQVQGVRQVSGSSNSVAGESEEDELAPDSQATMKSFFQSKPKSAVNNKRPDKLTQINIKGGTKAKMQQRQALILLEEVDIIFEEDRQFWETILELAVQSRRPIIMTCNDEASVPLSNISAHAIFRFRPTPIDLATDYMLLIAAAEGHLLDRSAVTALYKAKGCDLRASIMELNFWCQMGVGDRKGGMEWYLKRWPPGCDVDDHGDTLRVISESTYRYALGWLGQTQSPSTNRFTRETTDEEQLTMAWREWNMNPSDLSLPTYQNYQRQGEDPAMNTYRELRQYERISDALSGVDISCGVDLPSNPMKSDSLDPTLPPISNALRQDYPCSATLLDTAMLRDYHQLDTDKAVTTASILQHFHPQEEHNAVVSSLEGRIQHEILNKVPQSKRLSSMTEQALEGIVDSPLSLGTRHDLATDVAPYIRSIVSFDVELEKYWAALNDADGKNKRPRKTRSSRSALEGSQRSNTRRERWFPKVKADLVLSTGGEGWQHMGKKNEDMDPDAPGSQFSEETVDSG